MPPELPAKSPPALPVLAAGPAPAGLYLVATPVGNLKDITLRALEVLAAADHIACEDTRVSRKLLAHYGIRTPVSSYHEHNGARARPALLQKIREGQAVALISDAGTPLLADPGYKLVTEAVAAGVTVTALPGASALLPALILSGLPTAPMSFLGFLPDKAAAREQLLLRYRHSPETLACYVTPHKLAASLQACRDGLGERPAVLARELTKLHETAHRGTLSSLAGEAEDGTIPLKGEMVLVIGPPESQEAVDSEAIDRALRRALGSMRVKEAAAFVAAQFALPKRDIYARALQLQQEKRDEE